jgi:two-component system, LytTR family, sensor kinase
MKDRLLKISLITSPIIAIYGLSPIFLINSIELSDLKVFLAFAFLTILIFSFWMLNIYLIKKDLKKINRYVLSYFVTFLLHTAIILPIPELPAKQNIVNFLIYSLISTLAINTIILVIISSELMKRKKDIAETENQRLKLGNLEAQKQVLLQQLHPHFLFNALGTLKSLIKETPDEAEDYSVKLSEFLRYSIQAQTHELVSVQEELRFTQDYIELQKMRFGNSFDCKIEIPDYALQMKLPIFALQTLVENAIKHNGFTNKNRLLINIEIEDDMIKVSNNKILKILIMQSGIGLKNLNERYQLVSNQTIKVINEGKQFTVFLNLLGK